MCTRFLCLAATLLAHCAGHEGFSDLLFVPSKTTLPEINVFKIVHLVGAPIRRFQQMGSFACIPRLRRRIQSIQPCLE